VSVRVEVRPPLLEWARARSGVAEGDWDRRFPRYQAWLAGDTAPTLKQLEEFAHKTHTPVGFLFLDTPPAEPVPIPDFRTVGDRPVGAVVSADLLDVIYACERRQEWYRDHQLLNGEDPVALVGTVTTATPVVAAAAVIGEVLGWGVGARGECRTWSDALTRLRENAEAAGVLVMISGIVGSDTHRKLRPEEFSGFALADDYAPLVFINGADRNAAQVFTFALELAHLWLGESALSDFDVSEAAGSETERWCHSVALVLVGSLDLPEGRCIVSTSAVGRRFARALIASTLEGSTSYVAAFRLLGIKRASKFDGLADELGLSSAAAVARS
jgi:hypothetical protein